MFRQLFGSLWPRKEKKAEEVKLYMDYHSKSGRDNFKEKNIPSISDIKEMIEHIPEREYCICVTLRSKKIDYGNFYLWVKGDHSKVRLDEHTTHYYPQEGDLDNTYTEQVKFVDDYEVPITETTTYEESLALLYNWLDTGDFPRFKRYFH